MLKLSGYDAKALDTASQRPVKVADALDQLGRRIVSGGVAEGAMLPVEAALAKELGVSRPTLREAIKTLVALGLVEVRTRHGTRVCPRRQWNILNRDVLRWMTPSEGVNAQLCGAIDEAREIFEPAAAALAAKRADRRRVAEIRRAYDDMALAAEEEDITAAVQADRAFHLAILSATGNPIISTFDAALDAVLGLLFRVATEAHFQNFRSNLVNHRGVLEAIERREPEAASAAMLETILFTRRHLVAHNLTKTATNGRIP